MASDLRPRFGHPSLALWLSFTPVLVACGGGEQPVAVRTQTLVISAWLHDDDTPRNTAYGLDLDSRDSDGEMGCDGARDFRHPTDARGGIDNQYVGGTLLGLLLGFEAIPMTERVRTELEAGRSLYGLEITAPTVPDGPIEAVFVSYTSTGALPRPVALQAEGSLVPTGLVNTRADRRGDNLTIPLGSLDIPMGDRMGPRRVEDALLSLVIDPDGMIRRGDFGGTVTIATVVEVAQFVSPVRVEERDVRALAMADLRPNPSSGDCDAVSIGLGLELVPVVP